MNNWAKDSLGSLVSFQKGRKVATSPFVFSGYKPYIGATALEGKSNGYADAALSVQADQNDVLMLWDGERSGLVGHGLDGVVSSTVAKLTPNGKIDSTFLYYSLLRCFDWIQHRRTGTGVPHVPKDLGRILILRYPERKTVQKKIATILSTIDRTIEKTEALIDKDQQIKQGLMHDLFTRGIAANGKFRPSRSQAPDLYKKTSVGWIPKEWRIDYLANLLAPIENSMRSGPFGSSLLKSELVEEGIPFLGIDNIFSEHFHKDYKRFVSWQKFTELHQYAVRPRDVIITIMGTVGRCAVAPTDIGHALSSKHLWTMTLDQGKVIPELVCWQLNYASWVRSWFRTETQGGIMDAIRSTTLRTLRLPIPPLVEQKKIFQRYKAINQKIEYDISHVRKLHKQKSGLMHDLLTGRVEVKLKENEANHV